MFTLESLGWDHFFESQRQSCAGLLPARIVAQYRDRYRLLGESGEMDAEVSGRLRHTTESAAEFPVIGDWVLVEAAPSAAFAVIHQRLERRTSISRRAPGSAERRQVLAANVDVVFIASSLNLDHNLHRLDRYVTLVWESGALPVLVLSKLDLCSDPAARIAEVRERFPGIDVIAICAPDGRGLADIRACLPHGRTAAVLGSSGVGKSTLVNALVGEERLVTSAVREDDDRGRHTTTHRELICLPGGGMIIDTPGMRELQLWSDGEGLGATFEDVETLAKQCRFSDCQHRSEPGCAIRAAIESGTLSAERYEHFLKLQREIAFHHRRADASAAAMEKSRWKMIHKQHRQRQKFEQRIRGR